MERAVLNAPLQAPGNAPDNGPENGADVLRQRHAVAAGGNAPRWKRRFLVFGRLLFLGSALGILVWRLAGDRVGALDAARKIALAWTVGFIAAGVLVMAPAGLGVREVALLMVLGPVVADSGAVAAVVLLSRIVHTLSDGAWALVGIGLQAPQHPDATDGPHPVRR